MAAETKNLIKQVNLQHVRAALLDLKIATKPQLAEYTSLSVITVNALTKTLQESGEVLEDAVIHPTLGRPAMSYRLNETYCMALIVYTFERNGQDTAFFVVRNLYGDSVEKVDQSIDAIDCDCFDDNIEYLLKKYPSIRIIGFGLPATESDGVIISSDYSALIGHAFCTKKETQFQRPVFLVNDIKAATVGYCHVNRIASRQCVIGLYLPHKYSPGIGICHHGKLLYGSNGLAGRVSELTRHIDWKACDYGVSQYQDAIAQLVYTMVCLYNPNLIVTYAEENLDFLGERLEKHLSSPIGRLLLPELVFQHNLDADFRAGITRLALDELCRLKFPIQRVEE